MALDAALELEECLVVATDFLALLLYLFCLNLRYGDG